MEQEILRCLLLASCFFKNKDFDDVANMTVTIFEVDGEGKTLSKLDTNAFNDANSTLGVAHDPSIRSVVDFVEYVKLVLDRSDRDPKHDDVVLPSNPPTKEKKRFKIL